MSTALKQLLEAEASKPSAGASVVIADLSRAISSLNQLYADSFPHTGGASKAPEARTMYVLLEELKKLKRKLVKLSLGLGQAEKP